MSYSNYIPNILLCGDKADFSAQVDQRRPFKIVGQINFTGEINGQKFNFLEHGIFTIDGKPHEYKELPNFLRTDADYLVFKHFRDCINIHPFLIKIGCPISQIITIAQFNALPADGFYDLDADIQLINFLQNAQVSTLLDFNAHFAKSRLLTKGDNILTETDCICENPLLPVNENIYTHVYKNFSECCFKHYDAALIVANSSTEFDTEFFALEHHANFVIVFAKHDSEVNKHIHSTLNNFSKVEVLPSVAGDWFICWYHTPPEDFAMYVVTHKALPQEYASKFPEGYKLIHAGRGISADLGYLGDNTGENISHLNPYINEVTALYWFWKNTNHTIVGLSHYRRFFTEDDKTFLSREQISDILKKYDVILTSFSSWMLQIEYVENDCDDIAKIGESIIRNNLMISQPDYVETFDTVMNSRIFFRCNMFVTRRYILDSYCKWLFSFFVDAVRDAIRILHLSEIQPPKQRLIGYFAERMWTVWLTKNNLRIKELNLIQVDGL